MFRSIYEVEATKDTIRKVQREITRRRNEIRRNTVANAGIAMRHVKQLEHQNNQRKAALYTHRGQIEALYRASGKSMRSSFLTPDGPRDRGNRSRPIVSIRDRMFGKEDPRIRQPRAQLAPPTNKQRKKETPPAKPITMEPPATITLAPAPVTTVTPAKPAQMMQQAADSTRQMNHQLAAEKASAIRAQEDAKRDMELVAQGKEDLVAARRKREAEERRQEAIKRKMQESRSKMNSITDRARQAESRARSAAQSFANRGMKTFNRSISKARFHLTPQQRSRMGARGTGLLPQLALMSAFTDKRRAQTINDATRTKESVPTGPIKDQITEDVRQHKGPVQTRSKAYHMMVDGWNQQAAEIKQMIAEALQGRGFFADAAARLGPDQAKAYANRALSLIAQATEIFMNEVTRWDQGGLSSGVAISTDTRSQSKRKMTEGEFKRYIMTKIEPMAMDFMREVEQAIQRAEQDALIKTRIDSMPTVPKNISISPGRQMSMASADKFRGHGRPVLSEQQGTKGLAGLFPALRSSMQGALRR